MRLIILTHTCILLYGPYTCIGYFLSNVYQYCDIIFDIWKIWLCSIVHRYLLDGPLMVDNPSTDDWSGDFWDCICQNPLPACDVPYYHVLSPLSLILSKGRIFQFFSFIFFRNYHCVLKKKLIHRHLEVSLNNVCLLDINRPCTGPY